MLEEVARARRTRALGRFRGVCASAGLVALPLLGCSTYDASLLIASNAGPDAAVTAGGASAGGAGGENAGGASSGTGAQGGLPSPPGSDGDAGAAGQGAGASAGAGAGTSGSDGASGASSAGSGGTLSGGGSGGSGVAGAVAAAGSTSTDTFELIDDFEDGDAVILPLHKRNGPWYVFHDSTTSGTESPFTIALLSSARAASLYALHFTASGFTDWGAGVGANFLVVDLAGKKVAYDVSAYRGIQFYAKIASGTQSTLKLFVPTTYSDPDGGKCSGTVDGTRCGDHLYCQIGSLKTDWALYTCQFSDLAQQGFGLAQSALDPTSVYSVQFTLSNKVPKVIAVDIWIDDVAFIKK